METASVELIYRMYLHLMARLVMKVRPHKFNRWEKALALNVPRSLLRKAGRTERVSHR